jgi:hypothetical protein
MCVLPLRISVLVIHYLCPCHAIIIFTGVLLRPYAKIYSISLLEGMKCWKCLVVSLNNIPVSEWYFSLLHCHKTNGFTYQYIIFVIGMDQLLEVRQCADSQINHPEVGISYQSKRIPLVTWPIFIKKFISTEARHHCNCKQSHLWVSGHVGCCRVRLRHSASASAGLVVCLHGNCLSVCNVFNSSV